MKVAFLIESFDPRRGGMETSAQELLVELAALGIDVHVVTQRAGPGFDLAPVHPLRPGGWGRAGRYLHFVDSAEEFLARDKWDIIHAVTPCRRCDLYQPRAGVALEALARTVATRKNPLARCLRRWGAMLNRKQRLLARLERGLFQQNPPAHAAAISSYMRHQLEAAHNLPPDQIHDVLNGVTIPLPPLAEREAIRRRLRRELNLAPEDLAALFVGHNFRRKGLLPLLEALARPEAAAWRLLVAGKDPMRPYRTFAAKLGVAGQIQFLGPRDDIRHLYLAADACVLPTYYDPCSRTILEALSLGLPSITTRFDGSADAITGGQHGFVISGPEASPELAGALHQLEAPDLRARMSAHALALRPHLSMARHARQLVQAYEKIVAGRPLKNLCSF